MPEQRLRPAAANIIRSVAVDFRIGDGQHDPATLVSHAVLGGLRHIYDRTGILADDQRYVMGTDTDAFRMADYRSPERLEDFGANPWHVILLTMSGGYIIYRVLRGDRHLRLPALLAIGLALGFALFSATARWSVFVTRYQVPLLVAWSPLIAIALASLPRLAGRVVVALLLIACLPQLLDNQTRSLLHPTYHFPSDIARYFQFFGIPDARVHDYEMVRDVIANSTCDRVGIGNWILVEYPIWAGLEHVGWRGTIEHVGVQNESAKLEDKDFLPCAVLKEVPPDYIAEDTGRVHLRFGQLALSIDADRLSTATISGLVGDGAREP